LSDVDPNSPEQILTFVIVYKVSKSSQCHYGSGKTVPLVTRVSGQRVVLDVAIFGSSVLTTVLACQL